MAGLNTTAAWQRSLLPLMVFILVAAAVFFSWRSVAEFSEFSQRIAPPTTDLMPIFDQFEKQSDSAAARGRMDYLRWKSLALLEQAALKHRYAQVSAAILARAWTRLMGFTTGMVLAIVGAAFILGKLREGQTELRQESELLKMSLVTTSPGIVLAALGCILMSITLLTRFDIDVRDVPVYVNLRSPPPLDPTTMVSPPPRPSAPGIEERH